MLPYSKKWTTILIHCRYFFSSSGIMHFTPPLPSNLCSSKLNELSSVMESILQLVLAVCINNQPLQRCWSQSFGGPCRNMYRNWYNHSKFIFSKTPPFPGKCVKDSLSKHWIKEDTDKMIDNGEPKWAWHLQTWRRLCHVQGYPVHVQACRLCRGWHTRLPMQPILRLLGHWGVYYYEQCILF